ncbi:MAG: hypothetical protein MPN21_10150 [Thermoanaerobaculia bacterium]|nr:hypothetical protein [Thermoanaerobaculia bacterium]
MRTLTIIMLGFSSLLLPIAAAAQSDSCFFANDNACDEARFGGTGHCSDGTDSFDCAIVASGSESDNTCHHANDGECDEPRFFGGSGTCRDGTDANDCANAQTLAEKDAALFSSLPLNLQRLLGDNSCEYASDLQCDDAQFGGTGYCEAGTDAADCRPLAIGGDDSCEHARDEECDESRYVGIGACRDGSDTTDCASLKAGGDGGS